MIQTKEQLQGEIRYAQRLCQRTARLYRRVQTCFTFLTIISGSGALVALASKMPSWATIGFALAFAVFAAVNLAVRPAEKIAQNDVDVRKYAALLTKSESVDVPELKRLIAEARQSDAPEVEPLRNVAYNDVMFEINRADALIPLSLSQRILLAIA